MPASKIGADGKFARADLHMKPTHRAIPGGGTGANSAFLFHTATGYAAGDEAQREGVGTSIFDPVLCELVYRWFCPKGGVVLDPFAGGSVRGIVAAMLDRHYVGIELRPEQAAANEKQKTRICPDAHLSWIVGDARDCKTLAPGSYDLVFSCPPYADLEVYSDDSRDISTLKYDAFLAVYNQIIGDACSMLKQDRFAVFVVGEVRDKKTGFYRGFVADTLAAFKSAGMHFYNEAILVTAIGSLPVRITRQFNSGRKLGKTHQNVLVFIKGDPKKASAAIGTGEE